MKQNQDNSKQLLMKVIEARYNYNYRFDYGELYVKLQDNDTDVILHFPNTEANKYPKLFQLFNFEKEEVTLTDLCGKYCLVFFDEKNQVERLINILDANKVLEVLEVSNDVSDSI